MHECCIPIFSALLSVSHVPYSLWLNSQGHCVLPVTCEIICTSWDSGLCLVSATWTTVQDSLWKQHPVPLSLLLSRTRRGGGGGPMNWRELQLETLKAELCQLQQMLCKVQGHPASVPGSCSNSPWNYAAALLLLWLLRLLVTVRICTWLLLKVTLEVTCDNIQRDLLDGRLFYQGGLVQQIAKGNMQVEQWKTTIDLPCMNLIIFPTSACPSSLFKHNKSIVVSTVQLACCKTFAICCKSWQSKGDTQRESHNSGP